MKLALISPHPMIRRWRMAVVLAGAASLLWAQGGPPPGSGGANGAGGPGGDGLGPMSPEHLTERLREPRVSEALKLTEAQLKRLDQIGYDAEKRMIDLHGDLQRAQLDMKQAMQSDSFDAAAIHALAEKWSALHAKGLPTGLVSQWADGLCSPSETCWLQAKHTTSEAYKGWGGDGVLSARNPDLNPSPF